MKPPEGNQKNTPLLLSIITPTFNAVDLISGLIDSLTMQTDKSFEWVVVDGCSTDGTVELLKEVKGLELVYHSAIDFGIYDAINKGVSISNGEYYLVVGADDRLDRYAVENFKGEILSSSPDLVTAPVIFAGEKISFKSGPSWLYGAFSRVSSHAVGTAIKRSLHKKHGLYSRYFPIAADQLFINAVCNDGGVIGYLDTVVGTIGHEGLSSSDIVGTLSETFRIQLVSEAKFLQVLLFVGRIVKNFRRL